MSIDSLNGGLNVDANEHAQHAPGANPNISNGACTKLPCFVHNTCTVVADAVFVREADVNEALFSVLDTREAQHAANPAQRRS